MRKQFDVAIIGGGPAGSTLASEMNQQGYSTCLIERHHLGGTCLNYGCDPTKTLLHTAEQYANLQQAAARGITLKEEATLDWEQVQRHLQEVLTQFRGGSIEDSREFWREQGIELIIGEAKFLSPDVLEVDGEEITAKRFVIATGTAAAVPNIPGLQEAGYLTNKDIIYIDKLPERLAVIGAGPVGVEFSQMFQRFGVDVTLVESEATILHRDDRDLSQRLGELLIKERVDIRFKSELTIVKAVENGKQLTLEKENGEQIKLVVDEILIAVGRRSVLPDLNPSAAGLQTDEADWLIADDTLRTHQPHIWGIGDVLGKAKFTGVAESHAKHLAKNLFADNPKPLPERPISWVTFTSPALAHIGQTERQLKEAGTPYECITFDVADTARAITKGYTNGIVKLLIGNDDRVLGGHILAHNAGDLLGPIVVMMNSDLPVSALEDAIFPYPTMVEAVGYALEEANNSR